jgi:rRNA maturation protein Nop10
MEPEEDFDRIRCRECGRSYPALDGPALLYSLKASCPHCGGGFELAL